MPRDGPRELLAAIRRATGDRKWDPGIELKRIADNPKTAEGLRVEILKELLKHVHARPAAVDGEGNVAPVLEVRIAGYAQAEGPKRLRDAKGEDED